MSAEEVLEKNVNDDEAALKINSVLLSNNTYSVVLEKCLLTSTNKFLPRYSSKYGFVIQLDEAIFDVSNWAHHLVLVSNATKDSIRHELLLSSELRSITKGEDVFMLVDSFFQRKWSSIEQVIGY